MDLLEDALVNQKKATQFNSGMSSFFCRHVECRDQEGSPSYDVIEQIREGVWRIATKSGGETTRETVWPKGDENEAHSSRGLSDRHDEWPPLLSEADDVSICTSALD